ncbi:MAG TPA: hypothetical protein VH855_08155 [Acetobacteraceae bacterium]|jgi:hypothetical protein
MNPRRKPIFARSRRNAAQPHWLWVVVSLCVLIAVTLFDVGPSHHSVATSTPERLDTQLQASN